MSTGIITTVAGSGVGGVVGVGSSTRAVDNVAATSTALSYPGDVAVDIYGNIYILDTGNHRVRKVIASTGIITSIAGNDNWYEPLSKSPLLGEAATISSFGSLSCIAVDTLGNVYFADRYFNSIYKVTASTGLLTLVGGMNKRYVGYNGDNILATTALMNKPTSVSVDIQGNVFFADSQNNRIRKITASTGIITTVAGRRDIAPRICRTYTIEGNGVDATLASICSPLGIAVDTAGSIHLCQWNAVRKVTYSEPSPSSFMTGAPSVAPASSITVSPTAVTPLPLPSLLPTFKPTPGVSLSSAPAPALLSTQGSQSSSTSHVHVAGTRTRHLITIMLSLLFILYLIETYTVATDLVSTRQRGSVIV